MIGQNGHAGNRSAVPGLDAGFSPRLAGRWSSSEPSVSLGESELSADAGPILLERAQRYARTLAEDSGGPQSDVLCFRVRDEQYGVALWSLRAVLQVEGLTRVPCAPSHVAGVLNVRGAVVSVLDLAIVLGSSGSSSLSDSSRALLVDVSDDLIGLLVDEVFGVRQLALDTLGPSLSGNDFVHGVAESSMVLLNLERLFATSQLEMFEESA